MLGLRRWAVQHPANPVGSAVIRGEIVPGRRFAWDDGFGEAGNVLPAEVTFGLTRRSRRQVSSRASSTEVHADETCFDRAEAEAGTDLTTPSVW